MATRDVVVVGASAGGVEALRELVSGLPTNFPATVLVVLHIPPSGSNALAAILDRAGPLEARRAGHGEPLLHGTVRVAPPDHHLLVMEDRLALSLGPRENGHRPAVDVLFRSAARAVGARCIGVVLSGALDDGSAGLVAVRTRGGVAVVQDPDEALQPGMPTSAIESAHPEHVLPVAEIASLLAQLVQEEVPDGAGERAPELMEVETDMAQFDMSRIDGQEHPGQPAGFSCPDCSGALWSIEDGGLLRFRCRVGHAWSAESLLAQQSETLEGALWMALRSLEEKAALSRDLGRRADEDARALSAARFRALADESAQAARLIRDFLLAPPKADEDVG
ncbi:MAG TPA: chemotaxis protein CheB [Actinomycetales bacterium]|nr:chemotaxis protein CheB [Actinomycetales bacterium]